MGSRQNPPAVRLNSRSDGEYWRGAGKKFPETLVVANRLDNRSRRIAMWSMIKRDPFADAWLGQLRSPPRRWYKQLPYHEVNPMQLFSYGP